MSAADIIAEYIHIRFGPGGILHSYDIDIKVYEYAKYAHKIFFKPDYLTRVFRKMRSSGILKSKYGITLTEINRESRTKSFIVEYDQN